MRIHNKYKMTSWNSVMIIIYTMQMRHVHKMYGMDIGDSARNRDQRFITYNLNYNLTLSVNLFHLIGKCEYIR